MNFFIKSGAGPKGTGGKKLKPAARKMLFAALLLAVAFGLWTSFHYTFKAYVLEGDSSVFTMLWRGWQEHGFAFFRTWHFTQDNWLLSPAPFVFLVYYIFGVTGYTVLGLGWAFFVINAVLLAVLTRFLAGRWSMAALVILCLGLFASEKAVENGFLSYIICHNTSMAWAFVAVMAAAYGMEKRSGLSAFALACIIFIAGVSDPWFHAACTVPLLFVLCLIYLRGKEHRRQSLITLLGVAGGWALAYTRGLGLLSFLPRGGFQFISTWEQLRSNAHQLLQATGTFFSLSEVFEWNHMAGAVFIAISICIAFEIFRWAVLNMKSLPVRQAVAAGFFPASVVMMSAAYLAYDLHENNFIYRYLINIYYGLIAFAAFALAWRWKQLPGLFRAMACAWVVIFLAAGVASDPAAWEKDINVNDQGASALASFLEQNGLNYGYADYWAVPADTITWASGYREIVRPIGMKFDLSTRPEPRLFFVPWPYETSSTWYEPGDYKDQRRFFLVLNAAWPGHALNKASTVPRFDFYTMVSAAERQFGTPEKTLQFANCVVLVWDHPVLQALTGAETPGQ
ncbi:MAG: hypothetical protein M0018_04045 [Nitrospiraceae bacterium]|nr:hypothetical protein [Nitrospiraceae bacterium]